MTRVEVLYVVLDRPEDATLGAHEPNIRGLEAAVTAFDPWLIVRPITIAELESFDAASFDATLRPFAIVGAGSFSEWHLYGVDEHWKRRLDHWMLMIRETTVPMLAICGSHQVVAMAFNGLGAVGHMCDVGKPATIADELVLSPPIGLWPTPRIGEEGTYPLRATNEGLSDPLVRAAGTFPLASVHHKDMVVDPRGFKVLYETDPVRAPLTTAGHQPKKRCAVQGMRLDRSDRLLYSVQFHPEMNAFMESTSNDRGFGAAFLHKFLELSRQYWHEQENRA